MDEEQRERFLKQVREDVAQIEKVNAPHAVMQRLYWYEDDMTAALVFLAQSGVSFGNALDLGDGIKAIVQAARYRANR